VYVAAHEFKSQDCSSVYCRQDLSFPVVPVGGSRWFNCQVVKQGSLRAYVPEAELFARMVRRFSKITHVPLFV